MSDDGYETRLAAAILDGLKAAGVAATELRQAVRLMSDTQHARDVAVLEAEVERLREIITDREGRIEAARQTFEQLREHIPPSQRAVIDGFIPIITVVESK